jgi:hypothetical protein
METADRFTAALAEQTQRDNNQFTPPPTAIQAMYLLWKTSTD